MGGEAMTNGVRVQRFVHPSALNGLAASVPDDLLANGSIGGVMSSAGKQPLGRLAPQASIVFPQFLKQDGAERDIAVPAALALLDVKHHAGRVDIDDPEGRHLGA